MDTSKQVDLVRINFAQLRAEFPEKKHQNIQFADLVNYWKLLKQMLAQNKTRGSFLERFEKVIEDYNSGSMTLEEAYDELASELKMPQLSKKELLEMK